MSAIALYLLFSLAFCISVSVNTYKDRVYGINKTLMNVVEFMGWFYSVSMLVGLLVLKILIFNADSVSSMFKYIDFIGNIYKNWYFFTIGFTIQLLIFIKVLLNLKVSFWEFIFAK